MSMENITKSRGTLVVVTLIAAQFFQLDLSKFTGVELPRIKAERPADVLAARLDALEARIVDAMPTPAPHTPPAEIAPQGPNEGELQAKLRQAEQRAEQAEQNAQAHLANRLETSALREQAEIAQRAANQRVVELEQEAGDLKRRVARFEDLGRKGLAVARAFTEASPKQQERVKDAIPGINPAGMYQWRADLMEILEQ